MRVVCMVCAKGLADVQSLWRVNDYGMRPGIFACDEHARQAMVTFAKAHGVDALRPELQKHLRKDGDDGEA